MSNEFIEDQEPKGPMRANREVVSGLLIIAFAVSEMKSDNFFERIVKGAKLEEQFLDSSLPIKKIVYSLNDEEFTRIKAVIFGLLPCIHMLAYFELSPNEHEEIVYKPDEEIFINSEVKT